MNMDTVVRRLSERIVAAGSLRQAAKDLGVSHTLLSDVVNNKYDAPPKLLNAMGLERVVNYRVKQ